jgi:hypothetical protein
VHLRQGFLSFYVFPCIILVSESNLLDCKPSTAETLFVFILDEFSSQKLLQRKATWSQRGVMAATAEPTWEKGRPGAWPL